MVRPVCLVKSVRLIRQIRPYQSVRLINSLYHVCFKPVVSICDVMRSSAHFCSVRPVHLVPWPRWVRPVRKVWSVRLQNRENLSVRLKHSLYSVCFMFVGSICDAMRSSTYFCTVRLVHLVQLVQMVRPVHKYWSVLLIL